MKRLLLLFVLIGLCFTSCRIAGKISKVQSSGVGGSLKLYQEPVSYRNVEVVSTSHSEGPLMNAVQNENGDMVACDVLDAAIKISTFRNVAERNGSVMLEFFIVAPSSLIESEWQLRFIPNLLVLQDTLDLEPVYITGQKYRSAQLKGYSRYRRYIDGIITDSSAFVSQRMLDIFLSRNSSKVDYDEAVYHYTDHFRKEYHFRKASRSGEMFSRFVKNPIVTEGLRLDTVIVSSDSSLCYRYVQKLTPRLGLKKAQLVLRGGLYALDGQCFQLPPSEPLTFYISSLSALVEEGGPMEDSTYVEGLKALREHRFREALPLLVPYDNFNTALAYCALDYNDRALEILERRDGPRVEYVKAILYSRQGLDEKALAAYRSACSKDGTLVHRGNLDPEISRLKTKYNID